MILFYHSLQNAHFIKLLRRPLTGSLHSSNKDEKTTVRSSRTGGEHMPLQQAKHTSYHDHNSIAHDAIREKFRRYTEAMLDPMNNR